MFYHCENNLHFTYGISYVTQILFFSDLKAYVCNFREHWFTIRKIGNQWFNLNSLLTFPELISDTYLSLFLKQLQHEGKDFKKIGTLRFYDAHLPFNFLISLLGCFSTFFALPLTCTNLA